MALFLLLRDHKAHAGAVEIGWRVKMENGFSREGDVIFAYHASIENMLQWARHPARRWQEKVPLGIIDVRDSWIPEHKLFASVPVLNKVTYYMLDPNPVEEPGDPNVGMYMARNKVVTPGAISRRVVLNAAFGTPANVGSVRERLELAAMEKLNRMVVWEEDDIGHA